MFQVTLCHVLVRALLITAVMGGRRSVPKQRRTGSASTVTYRRTEDTTSEAHLFLDGISGHARVGCAVAPDAKRRIPPTSVSARSGRYRSRPVSMPLSGPSDGPRWRYQSSGLGRGGPRTTAPGDERQPGSLWTPTLIVATSAATDDAGREAMGEGTPQHGSPPASTAKAGDAIRRVQPSHP